MAVAGISTNGVLFAYAAETTAGTKPTTFTKLTRINQIGGISLDVEQIDASALEDSVSEYIAGRADTGGTLTVTVNLTDDTEKEWEDLISAHEALSGGKQMWFEVYSKSLTKAFFVIAEPPTKLPQPEMGQNELMTVEINLTINEYKGLDTAIIPS